MYFDLIGLPPRPLVVDEFVAALANDRATAIETALERLLNSPHYGERWGRHWLDVARYSDGFGGFTTTKRYRRHGGIETGSWQH